MAIAPGESPLYALLNEINEAAGGNTPLLAVAMTVALPDICVSLISEDGRSDGERYRAWCGDNLPRDKFSFVTPDDLYSMRCGVLHNGRFGDLKHNVSRVIFALPGTVGSLANNKLNDMYFYGVVEFCRAFTEAVYTWSEANRDHPQMVANLPRLMQYREGIPPFWDNIRVLA